MNNALPDGGGGGTLVQIDIEEFRALIKGVELATDDLSTAESLARSSLERLSLSAEGLSRLHPIRSWLDHELPGLRRRLAKAEAISGSSPGLPNSVSFTEESLSTLTPAQARQRAREAADLLYADPDSIGKLNGLLAAYGDDPYFAHEFALRTSPGQYAALIRDLTTYEELPGYLTKEDYESLLTNLGDTVSLADRGTGELAMPQSWRDALVEAMTMPQLHGDDQDAVDRMQTATENRPALWLLLARGHWSTDFLKQTTTRLAEIDKSGYLWFPPACRFIAISPDGERFMDPMVALMGALVNNPEAAHWAFTQGGTTSVPFPKDGEGATGEVQTFIHDLFTDHRFLDEEHGPQTVLLAMRAAMMWQNDPLISDSATNLKKSMEQQQEVWDEKPWYEKWGHTILDVLGIIPFVGEPADAVNAAWYSLEGDWVNAGLSSASLIPFAGGALAAGKLLNRAGHMADLLKMVDRLGNAIDLDSDLAKALVKGNRIEDGVWHFPDASDLSAALRGKHPNMEFRSQQLAFVTDEAGNVSQLKVYVDGQWVPVDSSHLGLRLAELKPGDSPWDLIGLPRGEVIESALAKTEYKGFEHVGKQNNGFFKGIDFYDDGTGVSLKTMDPPSARNAARIHKNVDDLVAMRRLGRTPDGRPLHTAEIDLRVRMGQENNQDVLDLVKYARERRIEIHVHTY